VGVDPGLADTGIAVIEVVNGKGYARTWETISTTSKDPIPKRLHTIYSGILDVFAQWNAAVLIVEDVFFLPKYPKAAMQLGAVHGILNLAAARKNIKVLEMKPTEVKMALTGNGRAPKEQVEKAVRRMCGITCTIKPSHASDALALAAVGLSRLGLVKW
jgi:crossover junction endodeoxyribonuclease RuvC